LFFLKQQIMKKSMLSVLSLVIMLFACSTPQNSVTNNNTPTVAPTQNQVPTPVKRSNKYQKNKEADKLMVAPAAMEKMSERVESAGSVRDTL
jgi:uncharacterized lipoprotein YajG